MWFQILGRVKLDPYNYVPLKNKSDLKKNQNIPTRLCLLDNSLVRVAALILHHSLGTALKSGSRIPH